MIKFANKNLERQFNRDGFVVLDILNKQEVETLQGLYFESKSQHLVEQEVTHSSTDTKNPEFVRYIDKNIEKLIRPRLNSCFTEYDYMLSTFIVKEPGNKNVTGFHQDPTLIDREDKQSANIWIALQDTDINNGCLQFIKGSHKLGKMLVVTPNFPTIFRKFQDNLQYFIQDVPLKAGQGVLFDNKTIHSANPNHSNLERIATVSALKSASCDWVYYYMDQETQVIEKYSIDYEAYLKYPKGERPTSPILEKFEFHFEQLSFQNFVLRLLKSHPVYAIKGLMKWLFKIQ
ncbi:MAG: phytanoyl-CoA dioxygenase family protein [Chitinophagales bacterium]|nr:phytanoyl-CoA dioxygenase family protein [Chitinophagales bacterium]